MSLAIIHPVLTHVDVNSSAANQVEHNNIRSESNNKQKFSFPTEKIGYLLNQKLQDAEEITHKELNSLVYIMFDHILSFNIAYPLAEELDLIITSLIEEIPALQHLRGIQTIFKSKLRSKFQSYRSNVLFARSNQKENNRNREINERQEPKAREWPVKFEFPIAKISDSTISVLLDDSQISRYASQLDGLVAVVFNEIILLNIIYPTYDQYEEAVISIIKAFPKLINIANIRLTLRTKLKNKFRKYRNEASIQSQFPSIMFYKAKFCTKAHKRDELTEQIQVSNAESQEELASPSESNQLDSTQLNNLLPLNMNFELTELNL